MIGETKRWRESILIVDDDESTCRILTLIFGKQGYDTETATTGQEAIEKAQGRFFNLALLDIKLPDMEGVELLAPLKEMHPDMVMIIATAYASLGTAVWALNEGASGYITKPLNMDEVLAVVREALEKQRLVQDKRQAEEALRVSHRFLEIANRHTEMLPLLEEFVAEVKDFNGCTAVGIRTLDEEGNIPYQAYEGFSQEFYESESPLSIKSDQCMCINVIKGTTDPKLSFYTEGGSFCMNGTTRFLATVSEEKKGPTRNVCNQFGYESVALVPIRLGERTLGLIHVADPQENMVPPEMVEVLEGVAMQLGTAIQRVRAEEALQASARQWRTTFDAIGDGVWLADREGKMLRCNEAMTKLLGKPFSEIIGRPCWELVHGTSQPIEGCPFERMRETCRRETLVLTMGERWLDDAVDPLLDEDGNLVGAVHVMTDITDRKRAEEALRESERRLKEAQAMGRIGDWKLDIDNQKITWSDQVFKLYERDPGLGAPTPEEEATYYSPEQARILREYARRSIETGEEFEYDLEVKLPSGWTGYFSACMHPIKDESGRVVELFGTVQDITERRRAEEKVRRHLERAEALREIDRAITSTLDLPRVLDIILEELERVIPYHSAGIFLFSDDTAKLAAGNGFPDMERALQISFPVKEDPLTHELLQEGHPLVLADAQADERFRARGGTEYVRSWVGVPLIAKERAVGFLTIDHREPGVYDVETVEIAQAFGSQVAIAIENARLYDEAQRELAERKRAEEELQHTTETLRKTLGATIQAMAFTVETRDPYTAGHQRQVANLARAIATEMGLSKEQIEGIRMAAVIHDIGKITVPTDILNKPGRLSEHEFGIIKCHPKTGYDVLKTIEFPWPIAQIIFQHHERMDGSGYPQGLSGEEIILEARILAVADVVEAMASFRPYRPALGIDKALEEITQNRGVLYDPEVVDACLELFTEKGFTLE